MKIRWALLPLLLLALSCSKPDVRHTSGESIETPLPKSQVQRDDLGVPLYPGAERKALATNTDESADKHVSEQYSTPDPVDKVASYFANDLGFKPSRKGAVTQLVGRTASGADVLIFIEPDGSSTKITIKGIVYSSKLN